MASVKGSVHRSEVITTLEPKEAENNWQIFLVGTSQHQWDWDNTEQRKCRMHEMLMVSQVYHYTGGTARGERSGRGSLQKESECQRSWPSRNEQSHRPSFSNHGNSFLCEEPGHCPNKAAPHTLPKATPSSNQTEDPLTPQYNQ